MTEKRFVAIGVEWTDGFIQDHKDDKDLFSVNAVCDLLNELSEENEQLKQSNKLLRANRKSCENGRINDRNFEKFDKSRVEHIRFLQKRLKDNGLSIYMNK